MACCCSNSLECMACQQYVAYGCTGSFGCTACKPQHCLRNSQSMVPACNVDWRGSTSTTCKFACVGLQWSQGRWKEKRQEKFTLFSDHKGSLPRHQPGAAKEEACSNSKWQRMWLKQICIKCSNAPWQGTVVKLQHHACCLTETNGVTLSYKAAHTSIFKIFKVIASNSLK